MNDQGFSRRELLRALALGGAVVAGELWVPGRKLISIPSGQSFDDYHGFRPFAFSVAWLIDDPSEPILMLHDDPRVLYFDGKVLVRYEGDGERPKYWHWLVKDD